jgi:flagellar capping protein FliD
MITAYNGVVTQINGQTGPNAGVLVGDPALLQLESTMQQLNTYQGSGAVQNLSDMGIDLASDGTMSLDPSVFGSLSTAQLTSALQFFGSATTGFGGLSQNLTDISDPIQGSIANEENSLTSEDANLQVQITDTTASINAMQNNLFTQLSQADTLISTLNSQQQALTASVQSLDYVLYGVSTNSGTTTG